MNLAICETQAAVGAAAAEIVLNLVRARPGAVLGVATGSSPQPVYSYLAEHHAAGFPDATCFALDEYVGLPSTHEQSYAHFVRRQIGRPLGFRPVNIHVPDGIAEDPEAACVAYEAQIEAAGGIDLQILGIGRNGHLAFNEPGSPFDSRTRVVPLTDDTRQANSRFFDDLSMVPEHAITQGLGTIMEARHLVLVVHGRNKSQALERALNGPLTQECPASILQIHPHVTVIADKAAAESLVRSHSALGSARDFTTAVT